MPFNYIEPGRILFNNAVIDKDFSINGDVIVAFDYLMNSNEINPTGGFCLAFGNSDFITGGDQVEGLGYIPASTEFLEERLKFIETFDGTQLDTFESQDLALFPVELKGLIGGWCAVGFESNGNFSLGKQNVITVRGPQSEGCKVISSFDITQINKTILSNNWIRVRVRLFNLGQNLTVEVYNENNELYEKIIESVGIVNPVRTPSQEFTVKAAFIFSSLDKEINLSIRNLSYSGTILV